MSATDLGTTLSPKVVAGTAGAGAGAIVTTAATWALGAGVFGGGWDAANVEAAMASVPAPLVALLALAVGVLFTFVPAWWIRDHVREEGADVIAARADDIPGEVEGNVITHGPTDGVLDSGPRPPEGPDVVRDTATGQYVGPRGK